MKKERITIQKKIIKDLVLSSRNHPSTDDIYAELAGKHPNISRATIYRNLNQMAGAGEIRRVEIPDSADRYDYKKYPHYHIQCRECGKIIDVQMEYMDDLNGRVQGESGFDILEHSIVFKGICPECKSKDEPKDAGNASFVS